MKTVVLGGSGFIGLNLLGALLKRGDAVKVIDHREPAFEKDIGGVEFIRGDYLDARLIEELRGADCVYHLAGAVDLNAINTNPSFDAEKNIIYSIRLMDACAALKVGRLIFVSSGGAVYGIPSTIPISEDHPTLPISVYGACKLSIEKYLHAYKVTRGLDYKIARCSNVYGKHQSAFRRQGIIAVLLYKALKGKPIEIWGKGDIVRDYVYAEDVAEALTILSSYEGTCSLFNIGSGCGVSVNELIELIRSVARCEIKITYKENRSFDIPTNVLDCGLAARELKWRARTALKQGITKTFEWMSTVKGGRQ